MLMQTGWIQASRRAAGLRSNMFATQSIITHKNKQNLQVLKSRRKYNLFSENYPAFKGLRVWADWLLLAVQYVPISNSKMKQNLELQK